MIEEKDFYTRLAQQLGVDRQAVKKAAFDLIYSEDGPESEEALELAIVSRLKQFKESI